MDPYDSLEIGLIKNNIVISVGVLRKLIEIGTYAVEPYSYHMNEAYLPPGLLKTKDDVVNFVYTLNSIEKELGEPLTEVEFE